MFLVYIFIFMFGAIIASFINLYVTRLINHESIVSPRSHCNSCGKVLRWYELIPIFSYIALNGRCSKCKEKIGIDCLLSELLLGILYVICFLVYGFTYDTLIGMTICTLLLSICLSDLKSLIILDSSLIVSIIIIFVLTFLASGLRGIYLGFLYGVFGFVLMFVIKIIGDAIFQRESLGGGDIKLSFITGLVLPYNLFLVSLVFACFMALPYAIIINKKSPDGEVPFGPFLTLGLLVTFLNKSAIMYILKIVVG